MGCKSHGRQLGIASPRAELTVLGAPVLRGDLPRQSSTATELSATWLRTSSEPGRRKIVWKIWASRNGFEHIVK